MSTLAVDINNPDKPAANPDPHPLTPVEVPVNAVICPTCRMPITDDPFQIDEYGIRYHQDCGVAPGVKKAGEGSSKRDDKDVPSTGGRHFVNDTQIPFMETADKYKELAKDIEEERRENEKREREQLEDIQRRQREELSKHPRTVTTTQQAQDAQDRENHRGQPTHNPGGSAKVTTPAKH